MNRRGEESNGSTAGVKLGANQSFLLDNREVFWIVDTGYVDIFAVRLDKSSRQEFRRRPFVARVEAGRGFTAGPVIESALEPPFRLAFLAVPGQNTVVTTRKRSDLASREAFDLDAVVLIDEWVSAMSEFVARLGQPEAHRVELIEADPEIRYKAGANISAHHLDVLWVKSNRTMNYLGHDELTVDPGVHLPLTERTTFSLSDSTDVTAIRTPAAIQTGQIWSFVDGFSGYLLRISELIWVKHLTSRKERVRLHGRLKSSTHSAMYRKLLGILKKPGPLSFVEAYEGTALRAAVEAVAQAEGAPLPLNFANPQAGATDVRHAVAEMVQPSGLRIRPLRLEPGWERRDGPSFLGFESGDAQRPLALINDGRGYQAFDPESGVVRGLEPEQARRIGRDALKLYAPLADSVSDGLTTFKEALRGRRRDIATIVAMGSLGALLALLVPVLTSKLLGEIIPRVDVAMWVVALIALALGSLCTAVFSVVGALSLLRIETRVDEKLQSAVWMRLLSLPAPFFRDYLAGDLADRANGVTQIRQILTGATAASVVNGVFSVFSYILLFWYNAKLALWAGAIMIVLGLATWICATRQIRHHRVAFAAQGAIDGLVVQMLAGISKLRQTNTEVHMLARWADLFREQKRETLSARYWSAGQRAFNALFGPLATLAILALIWFTLLAIEDPVDFSLSDFISFNSAFGQFVSGVTGLTAAWTAVVAIIPLFERVHPILEAQPETAGAPMEKITGQLEFQEVSFSYRTSGRDVLRKVSFKIRPGERVAFVGPSGSGKSTIYRLLLGFEQPASGTVLIDGHDLTTLDMASVRRRMGVVLQHMDVIPGSIFKNIASNMPLTLDEAWEAARMTGLDEDIERMPMGMHTLLPEGGRSISGGQKQRLLLARAIAPGPRVLLLDEPTGMLDNRSQATIQETLRKLNSTQVIIAHRLSTVQDADRIHVMQNGEIAETGTYGELMTRDGVFAALARRQLI